MSNNSENYNYLSATASKLLPWAGHIINRKGPITLTIFPTNKCNLNCEFCSNHKRDKSKELSLSQIDQVCRSFHSLQSIELSGGGDPCCYSNINDLIMLLRHYNLGIITNGYNIHNISPIHITRLSWLRISVNGLIDHGKEIDWDYIFANRKHVGISYILHEKSPIDYQERLNVLRMYSGIDYCKVCVDSRKIGQIDKITKMSEDGWMYKVERAWTQPPEVCYQHAIKPVLTAEGFLMPCSAIELSKGQYEKEDRVSIKDCQTYIPYHCKSPYCPHKERNTYLEQILNYPDKYWFFV